MLKCNYHGFNEKILLKTIMMEKYNPGKTTLLGVYETVASRYDQYLSHFDTIGGIADSPFAAADQLEVRKALEKCYDSATESFEIIRGKILVEQPEPIKTLCPYCLLNWPETIDHYIGKAKFPEFSILTKNLIPCCPQCNRKKLETWRVNGHRRFIHFYNDNFFDQPFLRARLIYTAGKSVPKINYYLQQPGGMSDADYQLVQWHFEDLELLWKYDQRATTTVSSEFTQMRAANAEMHIPPAGIRKMLLNKHRASIADVCLNYYIAVIYETLANDGTFMASLQP